jgi:dolichol-phosphate mannosyltransferase
MISLVLPVYNEEQSLPEFYRRLKEVLASIDESYEMIFVDDGSTDASLNILRELRDADDTVKLLSLSRNYGHQVALAAGIDYCRGDAAIVMDTDLQHPPELVPRMLEEWHNGYDVVYSVRTSIEDVSFIKRLTSRAFYGVLSRLTDTDMPMYAPDFKLMDRRVLEGLRSIRERSRFFMGLVSWVGYKQKGVEFAAPKRYAGETKYTLGSLLRFAVDGIVSFSWAPLRLATYFGFLISLASFVYVAYAVAVRLFTDRAVAGWASIIVVVLFLGGIQLITIGIIGEYIGRIYDEVKRRPLYLIRESRGFQLPPDDRGAGK